MERSTTNGAHGRTGEWAQQILGILAREGDHGESEIAHELPLDPPDVARLLHRMEHAGLVARTATGHWQLTPAATT
jgi:DNA-binding IclR family transcriptional regulator